MNTTKRHGTRIFKKATPNGKITVYLGKRDFIDHLTHVDPIEGVVLVDPGYVKDKKVLVHLLCAFRHGHYDNDLMGLNFHHDLFLNTKHIYPVNDCQTNVHAFAKALGENNLNNATKSDYTHMSRLQERLIKKLGQNAYPFSFNLPVCTPASVTLLAAQSTESGKPCRVDYELKVYVVDDESTQPQKRNCVRMIIRKLTLAPKEPGPQPSAEISREFLMSSGSLKLEATLDKQKYFHGEPIVVNVLVDNNSTKSVKRIRLTVRQFAIVCLPGGGQHRCNVAEIHSEEGFPIFPSQTGWCKVYRLYPMLANNRNKLGLALDGDLKQEDTNLASSTINLKNSTSEPMGINVEYRVKIRLVIGFSFSDICLELPFVMTHSIKDTHDSDWLDSEMIASHNLESSNQTSSLSRNGETVPNNYETNLNENRKTKSDRPITTDLVVLSSPETKKITQSGTPQMGILARTQSANTNLGIGVSGHKINLNSFNATDKVAKSAANTTDCTNNPFQQNVSTLGIKSENNCSRNKLPEFKSSPLKTVFESATEYRLLADSVFSDRLSFRQDPFMTKSHAFSQSNSPSHFMKKLSSIDTSPQFHLENPRHLFSQFLSPYGEQNQINRNRVPIADDLIVPSSSPGLGGLHCYASTAGSTLSVSEDDLIFEEFARFRLMSIHKPPPNCTDDPILSCKNI